MKSTKEKAQKNSVVNKIKQFFSPNPEKLVETMSKYTSYPYGKDIHSISKIITKSTKLDSSQKMELLLDAYGKYYTHQHDKVIDFATHEFYYEEFVIPYGDGNIFHQYRYENRFAELSAEAKYIVNREFAKNAKKIIEDSRQDGSYFSVIGNLDTYGLQAVNLSKNLKEDYEEKIINGVYYPSQDEKLLVETLVHRTKLQEQDERIEKSPFPEFEKITSPLGKKPPQEPCQ